MSNLDELRKQIDDIDVELLEILHKRLRTVSEVGKAKKELGMSPLDENRWNKILETRMKQAETVGLKAEFVKKILNTIHEEALQIEEIIKNEK